MSHPELNTEFIVLTGASTQESQLYLESHNWDINLAVQAFYRDLEDGAQSPPVSQPQVPQSQPQSQTQIPQAVRPKASKPQGSIKTLSDFSSNDNDSDEEKQTYFTGGEKSGQIVQAPKKDSFKVEDIFESAKKSGAEAVDTDKPDNFSGSGFRLGSSMNAPSHKTESTAPLNITFWKNGFQVGDSPLRSLSDPANKDFLEDIGKGIVPRELESARKGISVHLIQKNEDYVPPKNQLKAFSGSGQTLGSSSGGSVPSTTSSNTPKEVSIDASRPVTTLQIRLHDGTKLTAKFNHHHTVQDLRNFIDSAHTLPNGRRYQIMTTYPKVVITNTEQTLEEAKLLNSVIVQSLL